MKLPAYLGVGGVATFLGGLVVGWYGFPKLLAGQVAANVALQKGTDMRDMWEHFPDPLDFKVYLFNLTNPLEVQRGAKPVVQEIGPYFYDEYKTKENLIDHMENDSVSYNQRVFWYFNQEKSGGLTGDEVITMPHLVMLGMVLLSADKSPGVLPMVNKSIPFIFRNPTTVFMSEPARSILFEGVVVNCSVKDFSAKAVCSVLKKEGRDLDIVDDTTIKFSVFGQRNGTLDPARVTVMRGIRNSADLGRVVAYKGQDRQTIWNGDPCNDFRGTDSTIFPPFLKPEDGIVAFTPEICRTITAVFKEKMVYRGVHGYRYTADLGDQSTDPNLKCFCMKKCLKKGAMDISPCVGNPIVATLPHMFLAHDDYQKAVIGLSPAEEKHRIVMEFEPTTGTPLGARKRLQFNMMLQKVAKVDLFAALPDSLYPLFWVEEGLSLDQKFIDQLESSLFLAMKLLDFLKWAILLAGIVISSAGLFLHFKRRNDLAVNPVAPASGAKGTSSNGSVEVTGGRF